MSVLWPRGLGGGWMEFSKQVDQTLVILRACIVYMCKIDQLADLSRMELALSALKARA